ncbi:MAG: sensor histidine kinase [Azovibrio sp.]|nr:sensor histidine kinase [Azovibrio sp.]
MRLISLTRCCLLWLGLAPFAFAWGGDLIVARGLLEDRTNALTLADVVDADFRPVDKTLARGYSDSAFWLRIVLRAPARPGPVELRVRPTYLDDLRLYEPDGAGGWIEHVSGDRHGYGVRDRTAVTLGFVVHPRDAETVYYLRLKTASTSLLDIEGLEPREAQLKDLRLLFLHGAFFAVMLWIVIWAAHDYLAHRQGLSLLFVLYELSHMLYILALNGYLMPLVPSSRPEWADTLTSLFVMAALFFAIPFMYALYRPYEAHRGLLAILAAMMLVFPAGLVLMAAGHTRLALQLNAQAALAASLLLPILSWTTQKDAFTTRRALRTVFAIQASILLATQFSIQGWGRGTEWHLDMPLAHVMASALLMLYIMSRRTRLLIEENRRAVRQLELAQQRLTLEREHHDKQNRFMAMLVHELKTPISVMRMVLGMERASPGARRHAQKALHDMNAVVERCRQADRLEQTQWTPQRGPCRLRELLEEACHAGESPERFSIEAEPVPDILSDPQLLRAILGNLADNALKYSAPDSTIRIRLDRTSEDGQPMVRIGVENRPGDAGLPDPGQVFGKYYRSPHARHQTGSGLGLYLVRGFAELLGGRVEYDTPEGNVRFTVWLPET